MVCWGRRNLFTNCSVALVTIIIIVGFTACSRQTCSSTKRDSTREDVSSEAQTDTKNIQETEGIPTSPTLSPLEELWIDSGQCGSNAVWKYDGNTKILEITGTGVVDQVIKASEEFISFQGMEQYKVKEIRIGEGITALDAGFLFHNVYAEERAVKKTAKKGTEIGEVKIFLPDSLERIGADTFEADWTTCVPFIRHIHIPAGVRYIEGGAFWGIGEEEAPEVNLLDEEGKFLSEKYMKKLKITVDEDNPYYIVKDNVLFTKDLKTLVYYPSEKKGRVYRIPESVTHIKALAFARNAFLKEVILPEGLEELGAGAFFDDRRLTRINLEQAEKLKEIHDFDGIKCNMGYAYGTSREPFLGEESDPVYDDPIYDDAFSDMVEYQKDFYEEGIRYRKAAFFLGTFEGTALKSIAFPDSLQYASYNTFQDCKHLKKLSIGKSFAGEINSDRLLDETGFTMFTLPVTEMYVSEKNKYYQVKDHVLYSKDGKTVYQILPSYRDSRLVLDKNVRKVAKGACVRSDLRKNLREIVVLGDLTKISFLAFEYSGIESFEVYGNVERIAPMAFCCSKLKKFICHGNVKQIGELAFYRARYLKDLSLGNEIQSIGKNAFKQCKRVKKPRVRKIKSGK